jgi:hypothetical protein
MRLAGAICDEDLHAAFLPSLRGKPRRRVIENAMRAGPKRRLGLCCAIALATIPACRQIVGFDAPKSESGGAGADNLPKALPLLPFVPQPQFMDTCTSCAVQKCDAQHQACVDDPQCRELLRCYSACSDPVCIARCGSYDLLDYSWGGPSGPFAGRRGAEVSLLSSYQRCISSYGCPTDCGWGLDWGCLDNSNRYRWPTGPYLENRPLHLKLEVVFRNNIGASARVSAYNPWGVGMGALWLAPRETDGWGQVELEFSSVVDAVLQIESSAGALDEFRMLDYSGPFFRNTRLSHDVFPIDLPPVSPHAGFAGVIIAVSDCIGAPAAGIAFELEGASGQSYSYYGLMDQFVLGANTDQTGAGGFADVSPTNTTVTVLAKHGERTVARRTVYLRQDWLTSVVLRPLSGDQ